MNETKCGATVGYARTSGAQQIAGLEAQESDLKAVGCERIFAEHVSSVDAVGPAARRVESLDRSLGPGRGKGRTS